MKYSVLVVIALLVAGLASAQSKIGHINSETIMQALPEAVDPSRWEEELKEIRGQLTPFCEKAKRLLIRERLYMMNASLSPVECSDAEISRLRHELFASAMSHGGHFKRLIDPMDRLLYDLIKEE